MGFLCSVGTVAGDYLGTAAAAEKQSAACASSMMLTQECGRVCNGHT